MLGIFAFRSDCVIPFTRCQHAHVVNGSSSLNLTGQQNRQLRMQLCLSCIKFHSLADRIQIYLKYNAVTIDEMSALCIPLSAEGQSDWPFPNSFCHVIEIWKTVNDKLTVRASLWIGDADILKRCVQHHDQQYDKLRIKISKSKDVLGRVSAQRKTNNLMNLQSYNLTIKASHNLVEDTQMIESEEAARKVRKTARLARRRAQTDAQHKDCKQAISQWQKSTLRELQHSRDSLLPLDLWTRILKSLCDDIELKGVRGPSVIAREISLISQVNKELYAASQPAFQHLSNLCPSLDSIVKRLRDYRCNSAVKEVITEHGVVYARASSDLIPDTPQWDAFVSDPKSLRSGELKSLCSAMHLTVSRPKAVLIQALMKSMNLHYPTPTPACLIFAVQFERQKNLSSIDEKEQLSDSLRRAKGEKWGTSYGGSKLFDFRRECSAIHVSTTEALKAAAANADRHKWDQYCNWINQNPLFIPKFITYSSYRRRRWARQKIESARLSNPRDFGFWVQWISSVVLLFAIASMKKAWHMLLVYAVDREACQWLVVLTLSHICSMKLWNQFSVFQICYDMSKSEVCMLYNV